MIVRTAPGSVSTVVTPTPPLALTIKEEPDEASAVKHKKRTRDGAAGTKWRAKEPSLPLRSGSTAGSLPLRQNDAA